MSAHNNLKTIAEAILERTTSRTLPAQSEKEAAQYPHIAQNKGNFGIEMIAAWLHKIGEPKEDHFIVLEKCKTDSDAMEYFYKHANGEYDE